MCGFQAAKRLRSTVGSGRVRCGRELQGVVEATTGGCSRANGEASPRSWHGCGPAYPSFRPRPTSSARSRYTLATWEPCAVRDRSYGPVHLAVSPRPDLRSSTTKAMKLRPDGADGTNMSRGAWLPLEVVQGIKGTKDYVVQPALAVGRASHRVPEPRRHGRPRSQEVVQAACRVGA